MSDESALQAYVDTVAVETLLEEAGSELELVAPPNSAAAPVSAVTYLGSLSLLVGVGLCILAGFIFAWSRVEPGQAVAMGRQGGLEVTSAQEADAPDAEDRTEDLPYSTRTTLATKQRLTFTMPSRVEVSLQGPAEFLVVSANQLRVFSGLVRASVPEGAQGFRILTPSGEIVDHGTEIGVAVSEKATELHVFEGLAEVVFPGHKHGSMVGVNEAIRAYAPSNSGFEPIPSSPESFSNEPPKRNILFEFDGEDELWQATLVGEFRDRGDHPASRYSAGVSAFQKVLGFVNLPNSQTEVGSYHAGPQYHAPLSGGGRVLPLPFHCRNTMESLCYTSPPFRLAKDGRALTAYISGGRGHAAEPPASFSELPRKSTPQGFLGLALRRVSDGRYLCSGRRPPGDYYDWGLVEIDSRTLVAATAGDSADETYVLDLIDTFRGGWGWISLDSVSIPSELSEAKR